MSMGLAEQRVECPYCGTVFTALIDTSEGDADYIQDCTICCQPIRLAIAHDLDGGMRVTAEREDDA